MAVKKYLFNPLHNHIIPKAPGSAAYWKAGDECELEEGLAARYIDRMPGKDGKPCLTLVRTTRKKKTEAADKGAEATDAAEG